MTRPLLIIFLTIFVNLIGFGIIIPLLPFYAQTFGASPLVIGLLFAIFSLCQLIAAPALGDLSDRYGRRPVLIFSLLGTVASFVMLALAQTLTVLFLARIVDGLSGGNISTARAYVADITEPKDRARAYGLIGAAFGLGFILGPALSGVLSKVSYTAPIWAAAALTLAADPKATNSIDSPDTVAAVTSKVAGVKSGFSYKVPAHGIVRFRMRGTVTGATTVPTLLLGVLNGATVLGRVAPMYEPATANLATQNFTFDAEFALSGHTLTMTATITNPGEAALPFSFGFHPAFPWPFDGERREGIDCNRPAVSPVSCSGLPVEFKMRLGIDTPRLDGHHRAFARDGQERHRVLTHRDHRRVFRDAVPRSQLDA